MGSDIRGQSLDDALTTDVERVISTHSSEVAPIPSGVRPELTPLRGIRVVLFDVYGTLFVSGTGEVGTARRDYRAEHVASALKETAGLQVDSNIATSLALEFFQTIEADHRQARSRGIEHPEVEIRSVWQRVLSTYASTIGLSAVSWQLSTLMSIAYEVKANPVWPMVGAAETLATLRSSSTRIGIVSNAQFFTPLLFDALLGRSVQELGVSSTLTSWSYELGEAKPSFRMFQPLLDRLDEHDGISPSEVLYVGNDMLNDVWTAQQCGCRTVLFAGDKRSLRMRRDRPECRELMPDARITDLGQLGPILPIAGG